MGTISFQSLWAICLGTLIGAIILHLGFGETNMYQYSVVIALFIGTAYLIKTRGWST